MIIGQKMKHFVTQGRIQTQDLQPPRGIFLQKFIFVFFQHQFLNP